MAAALYLTTEELSGRTRIPVGTLRYWRNQGRGPGFIREGHVIRYPIAAVEAWERSRLVPAGA